jgi:hypothetical protein
MNNVTSITKRRKKPTAAATTWPSEFEAKNKDVARQLRELAAFLDSRHVPGPVIESLDSAVEALKQYREWIVDSLTHRGDT